MENDSGPQDPSKVYTHEVTGTWAYMAPEMLFNRRKSQSQAKKYGLAVDYWSLGCVAFELVSEEPDCLFSCEEELRKYHSWHEDGNSTTYLSFVGLSENAETLVSGLLNLDPLNRYGIAALRQHPYFRNDAGASEFDLHAGPLIRPESIPLSDSIVSEAEPALVKGHRDVFTVSLDPPENDPSFEHFGWINPRGIWGNQK